MSHLNNQLSRDSSSQQSHIYVIFAFIGKYISLEMLRKVVIGSVGIAALVPSVSAATPLTDNPKAPDCPPPMRPSDLPIYEAPHADYKEYLNDKAKQEKGHLIRDTLLTPVSAVREQAQVVFDQTENVKNTISDHYHLMQDKSEWIFQYLREEENKQVRYGAVAMGGLTGFIFGLRGGIIRRLFYTGLATTGMGLVCFPEDTKDILKNNSTLAKQYINIAYNFLYGVKPGDPQLEVKFPELKFPTTLSEFTDMSISLASSVKQAIMPPPTKDEVESKPADKKE